MGAVDAGGCGREKRQGGARARNATDAPTMPRLGDAGGCARDAGGWVRLTSQNTTYLCPRSWRIGRAGRGARVVSVRWIAPLPLGLCATLASAPSLLKNYDDMSIILGVRPLKIVTLIPNAVTFCPHPRAFVCLCVMYF